jgi:hypothetical protein
MAVTNVIAGHTGTAVDQQYHVLALAGAVGHHFVTVQGCQHQVEPDSAEMAARYGADTAVHVEWRERLVCSKFRFVKQPKAQRISRWRLSE